MALEDLSTNIRTARKARGLSQEAVARRADISLNLMGRIELGTVKNPHYTTLHGIAHALDMTVDELVEGTPGKASAPPDTGLAELLKKALVAARLDAAKTEKAINRLHASEGTLPATHVTGFESDKVGLELREAGFGDAQVEQFVWPLVTKVIEQEREISRLTRGNVADAAQETLEEATSGAREAAEQPEDLEGLGDLLGEWARSLYENAEVRRRLTVGHEEFARRLSEGLLERAQEERSGAGEEGRSETRDAG